MLLIDKLSIFYNNDNHVIKDISMNILDGECVLLTGESGSGKTSIISAINGLIFEYENVRMTGDIYIDNLSIKNLELYKISLMVASVFQNPKTHFFNVNTTLELLFYLENIGLSREEMDVRMKDMLSVFPIEYLLGRSIFELSGGEKQILCIAACYITGCKIIVLDEPSSNLDLYYIDILQKMLQTLKQNGVTLIIAEHRIYYLMNIVDRIMLIDRGKIKAEYNRQEFINIPSEQLILDGIRSVKKPILQVSKHTSGSNLVINNISYNFNKKSKLEIKNLSFDFGKIYGIIGKNGIGKSTFLRIITGLKEQKKSDIEINNKKINKRYRLNISALVMQDVNHQLFSSAVNDEIELGIKCLDSNLKEEILSDLGISELKDRHPMSLSGGQKQRVVIGSILCKQSKLIYFDEPTSGMDYKNMIKISKLIKKMMRKDNIIFIVSHDIEFLNKTADEVVDLEEYIK